ncbi:MAG: 30S ribosomal protein S1 [Mesoaciditoga sp.]|uniref:S1 RNA-binding domain-containing protein n=1 Tax=Athalassotoga sp. TaxID=2022597 RepID=UPI000CBF523A|nr:MAG: 30S ribosomal protein S1 [Mesoaciditoga sp.]PMP80876.1 MAG: 30S ribosomal protein S1 [Mesoaciditoga sp.]HEU23994.1 S1 RNA-binding domain-containing protein [Mesoaciditoga lauensis]
MENGEAINGKNEFEEYLENENLGMPTVGEVRKCTVVSSGTEYVIVDLGAKTEGIITKKELVKEPQDYKSGDVIEAVVINYRGEEEGARTYLSEKRYLVPKILEEIKKSMEEKKPIKGRIIKKVRGGYTVEIQGTVSAFLPGSQASYLNNISNDELLKKEFEFEVINFEERNNGNNIVLSMDALVNKEVEKFLQSVNVGEKIKGVVKDITNFGVFIDVGPMIALIPRSEISWDRNVNLKEKFKIGEKVEGIVISKDVQNKKMSVSVKRLTEDPWEKIEEKYPVGSVVDATVTGIAPYGIFVKIDDGIKGLVRAENIFWGNTKRNLRDYFHENDQIKVEVTEIDKNKRRISFSVKDVKGDPWNNIEEKYHVGDTVKAKVEKVLDTGIILGIEDEISGFAHVSELSWNFVKNPSDLFRKNQEVEVKILDISPEKRRMKLSVKRLQKDPWEELSKTVKIGTPVDCEVVNLKNSGAILRVVNYNVEGFLPKSQFYDGIKVGDLFKAKVHKVSYNPDLDERDMVVTIKDLPDNSKKEDHKEEANFNQGPMRTTIEEMVNRKGEK